jgi:tRNA/tmRNA/rRNA uracil-C5-methylase (TrmA/RlmC/RlmD family)
VLIEENIYAVDIAKHNLVYNRLNNIRVVPGKVETLFPQVRFEYRNERAVLFVDPPRNGLGESTLKLLNDLSGTGIRNFLYLSCNQKSLINDLVKLTAAGWTIQSVCPFDFFPKTHHIETLVVLNREEKNGF